MTHMQGILVKRASQTSVKTSFIHYKKKKKLQRLPHGSYRNLQYRTKHTKAQEAFMFTEKVHKLTVVGWGDRVCLLITIVVVFSSGLGDFGGREFSIGP